MRSDWWNTVPPETIKILLPISAEFEWDNPALQAELGRLLAEARADVIAANPEAEGKDVAVYLQVDHTHWVGEIP